MITDTDKEKIMARVDPVKAPLTIKVLRTGDKRSESIEQFCEEMGQLSPAITCAGEESDTVEMPSIELAPNVHYAGVPSAREIVPFMKMLTAAVASRPLPAEIVERLNAVRLPATAELYISPVCPHCPGLVEQMFSLAQVNSRIDLKIIDAQMFDDRAAAGDIRSVPTLVVDRVFRATGSVALTEVLDFLSDRRPSALGAAAMESMLKEGDASKLSRMMASENEVFPALLELLTHEKWPVRLGALVVLEELAALKPALADEVLGSLWSRFDRVPDPVKGDILYITGEIGGPGSLERITGIKDGGYGPEVSEAASDALQALEDRRKNSA